MKKKALSLALALVMCLGLFVVPAAGATLTEIVSAASYDRRFTDVAASAGYAQAVAWALDRGVTAGTGTATFSPNNTCTRGQIVTFLYRAFAQ